MNICNLLPQEQRQIELSRLASLAIHNLKRGTITRGDINKQIESLPVDEQESFRGWLNKYRGK